MYAKSEVINGRGDIPLEVGGLFSRMHELNITETAEVVAVSKDHSGVPHVRFNLISSLGPKVMDCGIKPLAVETFLKTYLPCTKSTGPKRPDCETKAMRTNITHLKSHI